MKLVFTIVSLTAVTHAALQVDSKALSPHTVGEPPHPRAVAVARELGLRLRPDKVAIPFDEVTDIVNFDLVAVMDRFDLEAVLREVSVFDALNPGGCYSARVRRLGDWAPPPRTSASSAGSLEASRSLRGDILDPLYGMLMRGVPSACLALTCLLMCRERGGRTRNGSYMGCRALDPSRLPWPVAGTHSPRSVGRHLVRLHIRKFRGQPAVGFEPVRASAVSCTSC